MTDKNRTDKIRTDLIRKQNVIFVSMIVVGISLLVLSQLDDSQLLSEGTAFILVGLVGMLMSWTTMDIGSSIKEAIYDVGRQNQEALGRIEQSLGRVETSQNEMKDTLKRIERKL